MPKDYYFNPENANYHSKKTISKKVGKNKDKGGRKTFKALIKQAKVVVDVKQLEVIAINQMLAEICLKEVIAELYQKMVKLLKDNKLIVNKSKIMINASILKMIINVTFNKVPVQVKLDFRSSHCIISQGI